MNGISWLAKWLWRSVTQRGMGEGQWCATYIHNCIVILEMVRAGKQRDEIISAVANEQPSVRMRFFFVKVIDDAISAVELAAKGVQVDYVSHQALIARSEFSRFNVGKGISCALYKVSLRSRS